MKIAMFIILTWGLGLLLPIVTFITIRRSWPDMGLVIPAVLATMIFACFIVVGEWWAKIVGRLIYGKQKESVKGS